MMNINHNSISNNIGSTKKKYMVFLRIWDDCDGIPYTAQDIEVYATDEEDAKRQWIEVYGEPFLYYNHPFVKEIK